ncbi:pyridoxal phosphate-dependent aminotransferase [Flavobacteriaceae bacterium]|jgi:aspartate aminotransferase|nr:pyridoxal phosphate-dependent aminotransferase [Flavobacteriaceae bacterium]MDA9244816.1 pyridoxal phosphate-dependent aminotransferase [Flavobacteriaceae bacterium]MDA9885833.1 pyridoxal phosphate-dependent aminotransferase [Flavobacteriaceae bacterium]MDA9985100.1 pyridoxal phosphate-dependent aminotransferase [Flavobacteriaceae bacterium]MDB4112785.1 pyridoxal phosphate-dependent aminotransferase [Flavobacteriaceae bacterium]
MPKISKKGNDLPESPIRKLVHFADAAKAKGIHVHHLNIGQPDIHAPVEAMEVVSNNSLELLPYGSSEGSLEYRKALTNYYSAHQISILPEEIIVTTGASEALSFTLNSVCDAGDEIIIPEPFYANYNGFAAAASVNVIPVVSLFDDQFKLPSLKEIETKITPKTRAILLCNPSNPTGYLYTKEEITALGGLALKYDLFFIVDEVYREFIHDENLSHFSVLQVPGLEENAVMIDSVSKRYSMCGARVGAMVSRNKSLLATALKFAHLRLSPATYALMASEAALKAPASYLSGVVKEYTARKNTLISALSKIKGVRVSNPTGAFYCMVELPVKDAEVFSKWLLTDFSYENETVMFAPAAGFYSTPGYGHKEVRIGFVLNEDKLIRTAEILEKALEAYPNH